MDVHDKATRSKNMAAIRGKDTKPELVIRKGLHKAGFRYRLHDKKLPGKPDLVFPKYKTVLFIHGCFWHQHKGCRYAAVPKTNTKFWEQKFSGNIKRDKQHTETLEQQGWRVLVIWECELKSQEMQQACIVSISRTLLNENQESLHS